MRRLTFLLFSLFLGVGLMYAQTKVSGTVISEEDGQPVVGAAVQAVGQATIGTVTDYDGKFHLEVPAGVKLLKFSYVGLEPVELPVKSVMNVRMKSSAEALDEVVVTGYGNFKKGSFTGSASSVSADKLKDVPTVSIQNKLAGSVAGVQVTSTSGQPGSVESVRIRGMGSINAGNEPLYVIDGVPMLAGNVDGFSYAQSGTSLLSTINSNDIESMTVIKDAAAASLYGSRAANGVIVITTKKGRQGKTNISLKADWGFSDMAVNYRPVLGGEDRRDMQYAGYVNYYMQNAENPTVEAANKYADGRIDNYAAKPWSGWSDWKDILFRTGFRQSYEVSSRGGNEKTQFFASLSYLDQEGITLQSAYERITGRINLDHKMGKFSFNLNTTFAYTKQDVSNENTSFASPIMAIAMTTSPSSYPYNEDGTFNTTSFPAVNGANPLQTATYNYNRNKINRSLSSISAQYDIWGGISLKEIFSYDFNQSNNPVWWDPRSNDGRSSQGVMQRYMSNRSKVNSQTQLTYNQTFAQKHTVDVLLGYEVESYKLDYTYSNGNIYPTYQLPEITNAANTRASSAFSEYRMISYLGRANYDFMNRYYASVSFRRDGSSRLSPDTRWGDFWSVSGSWRLSQEKFMENVSNIITDAKIRASYGVNGTQPWNYYDYMDLMEFGFNYNGNPGSAQAGVGNPKLKWEKNYATNIGAEITFLNRFSAIFEWYQRDTKDLLMKKPISQTVGFVDALQNVGEMRNSGIELELKSVNIDNANFNWTTTLNLAHNKNTLKKLDGLQDQVIDGRLINKVGEPYYSFYALEYAGVDPQTGKESYYSNKGGSRDIVTDPAKADRVIIGAAQPKLTGGLTNYMNYKGFDLGFTLTFSLGGHCYDDAGWIQSNGGTYNYLGNIPSYVDMDKMWKQPGDKASVPQFVFGNVNVRSSRWMMSTNHLRLKNMTFGYTLPKSLLSKLNLTNVRAYAAANNLFTIKNKDMYVDPEVPANGLVLFGTPALRTVTFGIEVGF